MNKNFIENLKSKCPLAFTIGRGFESNSLDCDTVACSDLQSDLDPTYSN